MLRLFLWAAALGAVHAVINLAVALFSNDDQSEQKEEKDSGWQW